MRNNEIDPDRANADPRQRPPREPKPFFVLSLRRIDPNLDEDDYVDEFEIPAEYEDADGSCAMDLIKRAAERWCADNAIESPFTISDFMSVPNGFLSLYGIRHRDQEGALYADFAMDYVLCDPRQAPAGTEPEDPGDGDPAQAIATASRIVARAARDMARREDPGSVETATNRGLVYARLRDGDPIGAYARAAEVSGSDRFPDPAVNEAAFACRQACAVLAGRIVSAANAAAELTELLEDDAKGWLQRVKGRINGVLVRAVRPELNEIKPDLIESDAAFVLNAMACRTDAGWPDEVVDAIIHEAAAIRDCARAMQGRNP